VTNKKLENQKKRTLPRKKDKGGNCIDLQKAGPKKEDTSRGRQKPGLTEEENTKPRGKVNILI